MDDEALIFYVRIEPLVRMAGTGPTYWRWVLCFPSLATAIASTTWWENRHVAKREGVSAFNRISEAFASVSE